MSAHKGNRCCFVKMLRMYVIEHSGNDKREWIKLGWYCQVCKRAVIETPQKINNQKSVWVRSRTEDNKPTYRKIGTFLPFMNKVTIDQ